MNLNSRGSHRRKIGCQNKPTGCNGSNANKNMSRRGKTQIGVLEQGCQALKMIEKLQVAPNDGKGAVKVTQTWEIVMIGEEKQRED